MGTLGNSLTPRERMRRAMSLREPDRVPIDFGSTSSSSISVLGYEKLKQYLGVTSETQLMTKQGQTARVDEAILKKFHVDTRGIYMGAPENWKDIVIDARTFQDEWGVQWQRTEESNSFFHFKGGFEGEEPSIETLRRFRWPDPKDPGRYRHLREEARRLHEETDYAVVFLVYPFAGFWAQAQWMRGFADFFTDLVNHKRFAHELLDRILEVKVEITRRAIAETRGYVDVMLAGDDLGVQEAPMVSMAMYEEFIKPRQKLLFETIKKTDPDLKLLYHTDGCVDVFLPHLIEIGIDGTNPVQVSAKNMGDTARLKREFGKDIFFWGAVDTGRVLPFGTREEVFEEVKRRIGDLGPGGGYVLAAVHSLQEEVPPENICAMFEAALEHGKY